MRSSHADELTRRFTEFPDFAALVGKTAPDYVPTLVGDEPEMAELADLYDEAQAARGDKRRAQRKPAPPPAPAARRGSQLRRLRCRICRCRFETRVPHAQVCGERCRLVGDALQGLRRALEAPAAAPEGEASAEASAETEPAAPPVPFLPQAAALAICEDALLAINEALVTGRFRPARSVQLQHLDELADLRPQPPIKKKTASPRGPRRAEVVHG